MGRHLPADIASRPSSTDGTDRRPPNMIGSPDPELVWTSLLPPTPRAGLIPREGLQSLLQAGLQGKLCLLSAPPGFGKTTLLTQWCALAGADRVAWLSLDEGDNDPTRFWVYVVQALRTVEPSVGTAALAALLRTGADLYRAVLPSLHSELSAVGSRLVLVLDDYHVVTNATCHQTLAFFLDHLPAGVHVVLSTRADPALPLARMRARGELVELRAAERDYDAGRRESARTEFAAILRDEILERGVRDGLPWVLAVSRRLPARDRRASMRLLRRTPAIDRSRFCPYFSVIERVFPTSPSAGSLTAYEAM